MLSNRKTSVSIPPEVGGALTVTWSRYRWGRGPTGAVGPPDCCHLVAFWIYRHSNLHSQSGGVPDCVSFGRTNQITGRSVQSTHGEVRATQRQRRDGVLSENGGNRAEIL